MAKKIIRYSTGSLTFQLWSVLVVVCLAGCNKKQSTASLPTDDPSTSNYTAGPKAGVAIIDVNQVAAACGAITEINRELNKKEAEYNLILDGLRKIHLQDLAKLEKELGEDPTDEQREKITELRSKQAAEYNVRWQNTRISLSTIKQKLDEAFLAKVRPIAKTVAQAKGLSVVLRNENVFCLVDQFDITPDVTAAYQSEYPEEENPPVVEVAEIPSRGGGFEPRK